MSQETKNRDTFTRAFRFICQLNLQDHSIEDQREQLALISEMKEAAKSVSIDNDGLADIAKKSLQKVCSPEREQYFLMTGWAMLAGVRFEMGQCSVCGERRNRESYPLYAHSVCWATLSNDEKLNISKTCGGLKDGRR